MSNLFRRTLAVVLVVCLLLTSNISVFAAAEEVYISDLRIVYAEDYDEAKEILSDTEFDDYEILNENLNEGTKEIGVWLAYKTTTDIEDAITDLAVMQMNGGYKEGNYQAMIQESLEEFEKMGEKYETVIEYFNYAYDEGYFLADIAYRQLNLYTVKTIGIDDKYIPSFEGELLGDIFYDGIDSKELATMFMEGNSYVLSNIRSLLAMGASYNEDGMTYMDKVAEAAAEMNDDPEVFADEDYDETAAKMVTTLTTIKDMFKEFAAYEEELNFEDEEIDDEELKYAEHKTLANMMRDVEYLDGETLYDFVLNYSVNKSDYSNLYPLVAALNEGQTALVDLVCYYNVIRYSMSEFPEEYLENEVAALEEQYEDDPFNVYEGVDRTVFKGTFALTTDAYRNDAYNDKNTLADAFFGNWKSTLLNSSGIVSGAGGIGVMIWGAFEKKAENAAAAATKEAAMTNAKAAYDNNMADAINAVGFKKLGEDDPTTYTDLIDDLMDRYFSDQNIADMTFKAKYDYILENYKTVAMKNSDLHTFYDIDGEVLSARVTFENENTQFVNDQVQAATASTGQTAFSTILFIVGGAMLLYNAFTVAYTIISYYNPDYEDIPLSMVDMFETQYGDRYIKYDVVREAEPRDDDSYAAGDLNAFEAQRWNALYYTKSYEAGKPLLADEFVVSTSNNKARDGYTPVHRFGEVVCYDLNKYNFNNNTGSIYLSVKQSKNNKSAVADVPDVVGSIFANGLWLLVGGAGAIFGVGGTLGTQALLKKKRTAKKES